MMNNIQGVEDLRLARTAPQQDSIMYSVKTPYYM